MQKIYRFRVLLDEEEDIFRDIDMLASHNFEDFHRSIQLAFGFDGTQLASFYETDEQWEKGREIALMNLSEDPDESKMLMMDNTLLEDLIKQEKDKLLYVYDFLSMWCFYIELYQILDPEPSMEYPMLVAEVGPNPDPTSRLSGLGFDLGMDMDMGNDIPEDPFLAGGGSLDDIDPDSQPDL